MVKYSSLSPSIITYYFWLVDYEIVGQSGTDYVMANMWWNLQTAKLPNNKDAPYPLSIDVQFTAENNYSGIINRHSFSGRITQYNPTEYRSGKYCVKSQVLSSNTVQKYSNLQYKSLIMKSASTTTDGYIIELM